MRLPRVAHVVFVEVDGLVMADAPWLREPVTAATNRDAFELAWLARRVF